MTNAARLANVLLLSSLVQGFGLSLLMGNESEGTRDRKKLRLSAVTILTDNFSEMLVFYRDSLELEIRFLDEEGKFVEFESDGVRLALTSRENMKNATHHPSFDEPRSGQSFELAFAFDRPEEVDSAYERVVARGATPVAPPATTPWGQRAAFFADPDGNILDLFAEPEGMPSVEPNAKK